MKSAADLIAEARAVCASVVVFGPPEKQREPALPGLIRELADALVASEREVTATQYALSCLATTARRVWNEQSREATQPVAWEVHGRLSAWKDFQKALDAAEALLAKAMGAPAPQGGS